MNIIIKVILKAIPKTFKKLEKSTILSCDQDGLEWFINEEKFLKMNEIFIDLHLQKKEKRSKMQSKIDVKTFLYLLYSGRYATFFIPVNNSESVKQYCYRFGLINGLNLKCKIRIKNI